MKLLIKNRSQQALSVLVENEKGKSGTVYIAHGLRGNKYQIHIQAFANVCLEHDLVTVSWDAANTLGESQGNLEDASLSSYSEDMEDVIAWSKSQDWYQEPFILLGHSLGAACCILYTAKYPEKVKALAPTSAFLSGKLYISSYSDDQLKEWRSSGYLSEESKSRPGFIKTYKWNLAEDLIKYELYDLASQIKAPILLMVGDQDTGTPLKSQQIFYDKLNSKDKTLVIITGASHTYQPKDLDLVNRSLSQWLSRIVKEEDESM